MSVVSNVGSSSNPVIIQEDDLGQPAENCPVCRSKSITLNFEIPLSVLLEWTDRLYGTSLSSKNDIEAVVSLLRCRQCGLEFFSPNLVGTAEYYLELGQKNYYQHESWDHSAAARTLHGARRILEVGSGHGQFASKLMQTGQHLVTCLEFSSGVCTADDRASDFIHCDLNSALAREDLKNRYGSHFDAISMLQVLEHLPQPVEVLHDLRRLIGVGGKIVMSVPNRHRFDINPVQVLDFPPHHQNRWTGRTLKHLGKVLGSSSTEILKQYRFDPKHIIFGPLKRSFDIRVDKVPDFGNIGRPWPPIQIFYGHSLLAVFHFDDQDL